MLLCTTGTLYWSIGNTLQHDSHDVVTSSLGATARRLCSLAPSCRMEKFSGALGVLLHLTTVCCRDVVVSMGWCWLFHVTGCVLFSAFVCQGGQHCFRGCVGVPAIKRFSNTTFVKASVRSDSLRFL